MNSHQSHNSTPSMKALSPEEQKVLLMVQRRRAGYRRQFERVGAFGKTMRRGLLIAACAGGLIASGTAKAAAAPLSTSAPALFNQANADQRAGHLGPAILGYERALMLAPHDKAIAQNLRLAQQKAGATPPVVASWKRPAYWLYFDSLAGLASISLLLFSLVFFGTRLIPMTLRGFARFTALSLGAITVLAATAITLRWSDLNRAVIVGSQPVAHIAPAASAAAAFELKPGELVWAERAYGSFVHIRTADGRRAWVSSAEIAKIIPSAS